MKNIVVDTNIVFSAILNTDSVIANLLLKYDNLFFFRTTENLKYEIEKHKSKLQAISGLNGTKIETSKKIIFNRLVFVKNDEVDLKYRRKGYDLSKNIDENDFLFISLNECFKDSLLWTGDKKLIQGLRNKGYKKVVKTNELLDYVNKVENN